MIRAAGASATSTHASRAGCILRACRRFLGQPWAAPHMLICRVVDWRALRSRRHPILLARTWASSPGFIMRQLLGLCPPEILLCGRGTSENG